MAESNDRVGSNHKIEQEQLRSGDHIYVHQYGGLKNKHGIYFVNENGQPVVAYWNTSNITFCSVTDFAQGECLQLYVYGAPGEVSDIQQEEEPAQHHEGLPLEKVVENMHHFKENPHEISDYSDCQNKSEAFARACNSRVVAGDVEQISEMDNSKQRVSYFSHTIEQDKLKPGDHIYGYRKAAGIISTAYQHHGIYIGQNSIGTHLVIHKTRDENPETKFTIHKTSLNEFLEGAELKLVVYGDKKFPYRIGGIHEIECLPAHQVIATAEHLLQQPGEWKDYDLETNNCEHFALYCKTGKRRKDYAGFGIKDQISAMPKWLINKIEGSYKSSS